MKLILIRGLPGSGKSTLARQLVELHSGARSVHLEADQYFVGSDGVYEFRGSLIGEAHQWCQSRCAQELECGSTVIVSNTFTTLKELRPYFRIARRFGITPTVLHCQSNWGSIHDTPLRVVEAMRDRFEYDIASLFETCEKQPETYGSI